MAGNPRGSGYAKVQDNWYQENRACVDALLDAEHFEGPVWDPACGEGNIPEACKARGMESYGTDLINRGYGNGVGLNFFDCVGLTKCDVITNPPFDLIEPFIHHALSLTTGKVAILGRLAFLEGQKRRDTLWTATPFSQVWVFSRRVSMPPGGQGIEAKGGSIAFAWYVWSHAHPIGEPAQIGFLP